MINTVSEISGVSEDDVKKVFDTLSHEIKFQLLEGNRIVFPGLMALYSKATKYKSRYSKKYDCQVKIENPIRIKIKVSPVILKELNYKKD